MTVQSAIEAARERLRVIAQEEQRLLGAVNEAMDASRSVPDLLARSFRVLADRGQLQRRWDVIVAEVQARHDDGHEGLLAALLAFVGEMQGVVATYLGEREVAARSVQTALAAERRTLEWIVSEANAGVVTRESGIPPALDERDAG